MPITDSIGQLIEWVSFVFGRLCSCHSVIVLGGQFSWNWSKVAVNRDLLNVARAVWFPVFWTCHRPHHVPGVRGPGNGSLFFRWIAYVIVARLSKSLGTLTLGSSKINQHCWRFHGSGVIAAPQIIGLISFCTGMHHEYFFRSSMCFRVPHLCSKTPKINNWLDNSPQSFGVYTVSQSRSVVNVRGECGPR